MTERNPCYVADYNAGLVNIYPASGEAKKPIGQIKGIKGPNGLAVDSRRNLYVTENSAGDVLVYPRGDVKRHDVLSDAGHSPESVTVADDGARTRNRRSRTSASPTRITSPSIKRETST